MKYIHIICFLIFLITFNACNNKKAGSDSFLINGTFFNAEEAYVVLEELTVEERVVIDSVKIKKDGRFYFKISPVDIGFYILKMNENNFVTLLAEKGEHIEITADARQIVATYTISGSFGSELIREINVETRKNLERVDSLRDAFERSKYDDNFISVKTQLDSIYFSILQEQKDYIKKFIEEHNTSLSSLIAIYQTFGQTPLLSEKDDFLYFEKLSNALINKYPNNPHSIDLSDRVNDIKKVMLEKEEAVKRTQIGKNAPEIILNNQQSESVTLSSLKGRYVLINFWAAWCAPCRLKNPELLKVYNKYKNKNFDILAVSLDRDKKSWEQGIMADNIQAWIHVSDLLFWQSPIVKTYNVESIPFSILIDNNGVIIHKNPSIEELDNILKTIL